MVPKKIWRFEDERGRLQLLRRWRRMSVASCGTGKPIIIDQMDDEWDVTGNYRSGRAQVANTLPRKPPELWRARSPILSIFVLLWGLPAR